MLNQSKLLLSLVLIAAIGGGFYAGQTHADQPAMQKALNKLQSAERTLDKATHDKGGHRLKALGHVRDAIREVERGIRYDRRN